jgi:hypothetical protein
MSSRRIILATILVSSLLTAGCLKDVVRELSKQVSDLTSLHNELIKKFGDQVFVNLNEGGGRVVLNVTFINSALNDKTKEDRLARAQETANIVRARYAAINRLSAIWVVFVREKKTLIFISERQSVDYYGFDNQATRQSLSYSSDVNSYGVAVQTSVSYIADVNESDISVSGIQLDGTPGEKGLTVLPHFRVKGDVRAASAAPPKEVSFDFASYANQEQFGKEVPITFIADDTYVLRTKGTFSVSRYSGTVSEFCYLKVPYVAFRKMIAGKQLMIGIGDRAYLLTPHQYAAVQQMIQSVND